MDAKSEEAARPEGAEARGAGKGPAPQRRKKAPLVAAVIVAVLVVAGAGFWVWHEQPSFCNAICHTPMDPYNETYDQQLGGAGVDKWGNEVSNTSAMLAVTHQAAKDEGGAEATCMGCHVPTLSEQVSEGIGWATGDYYYPLEERTLADLTEARGVDEEEFCLNEACHANEDGSAMTRADLIAATDGCALNPHVEQHKKVSCSECHKAHRASVMYCTECHQEAEVPDGWITASENRKLTDLRESA